MITTDAFLGGQVQVKQPANGYRAGVDPVLLAAACPASAGNRVLELGCGVGTAALCLLARTPGAHVTGIEIQPEYADLARENAALNNANLHVVNADLCALPDELRQQQFDHVIANPPYYTRTDGTPSNNIGRDMALAGDTPLPLWFDVATRRLTPGGWLTMIQRMDRLPDMIRAIDGRMGSVSVLPIAARRGRAAHLVILRTRKGGRSPFRLCDPLIMHTGDRHERDGDDYSAQARDILRNAAPLEF